MRFKHFLDVVIIVKDDSSDFCMGQGSVDTEISERAGRKHQESSDLMRFEPFSRWSYMPLTEEFFDLID